MANPLSLRGTVTLYMRYQVGNEHDRLFLNQASPGSSAHPLRYPSPDVAPAHVHPRGCWLPRGFVMSSGPPFGDRKLPGNCSSRSVPWRRGCSRSFPLWFPAASGSECQIGVFHMKRANKAFTRAVCYSADFYKIFCCPFEQIKKPSDAGT